MPSPFLVGTRLYLRPLVENDLNETYLSWLNDPETTRYLFTGRFPSTLADLHSYWAKFQGSPNNLLFAITLNDSDRHIGNVTLNNIHWLHRFADTGIMLGAKDCWGQGYAYEAWHLLITHAFQALGLHKVVAGAVRENVASVKALQKLGFVLEGTFRQEFFVDGAFHDILHFGLLCSEFTQKEAA